MHGKINYSRKRKNLLNGFNCSERFTASLEVYPEDWSTVPRKRKPNTTRYVNKNPTYATVCRYLFTAKLLYMFRVSQHPSSGVSKIVPAASSTGHTTCTATPLHRGLIGISPDQTTLEGSSCTRIMTCTGGCGYSFWYSWWWVVWHPKHVE